MLKKLEEVKSFFGKIFEAVFLGEQQEKLKQVFSKNPVIDPKLKLRIYFLLKTLKKQQRRPFGMIIVLGWDNKWYEEYASVLDSDQNLFDEEIFGINEVEDNAVIEKLKKTVDFDGAIFIDNQGHIVASGMYLDNMKPKEVAKILNPDDGKDMSEAFGFKRKVHTRHLISIAASYRLRDTTIFTISEEDGSFRVYENGKIIWSSIAEERK